MEKITADVVRLAYRLFLNRDAETDAALNEKVRSFSTYEELRHDFILSPEFRHIVSSPPLQEISLLSEIKKSYFAKPKLVEVDVPGSALAVLLDRVREQWRKLGESDPYWSVISTDALRTRNVNAETLSAFYETGQQSADIIGLFEEKTGVRVPNGVCFELGCGVGRVTAALARRFGRVIAVDISPGNLLYASSACRS